MSKKNSRKHMLSVHIQCENIDGRLEADNGEPSEQLFEFWDALSSEMSGKGFSAYEDAITYAFDEFDYYMHQDEYIRENSCDWSFGRYRLENVEREKFAHATQAQQELICKMFGVDEETVHADLMIWRRANDLYHKVAGLNVTYRHSAA